MNKVIVVDHFRKNISFTIQEGEMVALVGPRGAGKTTIIKMLSGLKESDSGFVSVLDFDPSERSHDFLRQISASFSKSSQLVPNLPVTSVLEINKAIYGISDRNYKKNLDELVFLLGASKLLETRVSRLQEDQRIKMELMASLIHKPKVLFLDDLKFDFNFLYEYNKRNNTTILLTSNNIKNLDGFIRRVVAIDNGKLIFDGPLEKLR